MSFWDDVSNFGSGLLDDVSEGVGNLIDGYTKPVQSDVAANPNNYTPNYPAYADRYGNNITRPQGEVEEVMTSGEAGFMGFSKKEIAIGGAALLALLLLTKR